MEKKKATLLALGLLSVTAALGGITLVNSKKDAANTKRELASPLDFKPTEEQQRTIALLVGRVNRENPHFTSEDARKREHAKLFTYIAATSDEPHEVQASLEAILLAYSSRSSKKEAPDDDLDKVLVKHLQSHDPQVVVRALAAARIPLMSEDPGDTVPAALVQLASADEPPEKRLAALEALNLMAPRARNQAVLACFQEALRAEEPYIVSTALFALENSALSFRDPPGPTPELSQQITALTEHKDPGVRGRALSMFTTLGWLKTPGERLTIGVRGLSDPHPYVRAAAADLLGQNGQPEAVHALIAHIEDMQEARFASSYSKLDGTAGEMIHVLPGRKRVAEAALYALMALSTEELVLTLGGPHQSEETIQKSAGVASDWYEKAQANLPPLATDAAPPFNPSKVD